MEESSKDRRDVVIWLDHEEDPGLAVTSGSGTNEPWVRELVERIRTQKDERHRPLTDLYRIEAVVIPLNAGADEAASQIQREIEGVPALILVDYLFGPHVVESEDRGVEIADALRRKYPMTAVGLFTKYSFTGTRGPGRLAEVSLEQFSLLLDQVIALTTGSAPLKGGQWSRLFRSAIDRHRNARSAAPPALDPVEPGPAVEWGNGHPIHDAYSFRRAAVILGRRLLGKDHPGAQHIELTECQGGFSGSYVVMAEVGGFPKKWVLKIDEDPRKIQEELDGYREVRRRVSPQYYPELLPSAAERPCTVADDWWGGTAMAFDRELSPLLEHFGELNQAELVNLYRSVWQQALLPLYGEITATDTTAGELLGQVATERSSEELRRISRYDSSLRAISRKSYQAYRGGRSLLTGDAVALKDACAPMQIPWAECVHGDLNCRNILHDRGSERFLLIDFPRAKPGNASVDFAKAEAELVLIMLDWARGRDLDLGRIEEWLGLTQQLSGALRPRLRGVSGETMKVGRACEELRRIYEGLTGGCTGAADTYRYTLLRTALPYVGYQDITIPKKFLAVAWAKQLAESSWEN